MVSLKDEWDLLVGVRDRYEPESFAKQRHAVDNRLNDGVGPAMLQISSGNDSIWRHDKLDEFESTETVLKTRK